MVIMGIRMLSKYADGRFHTKDVDIQELWFGHLAYPPPPPDYILYSPILNAGNLKDNHARNAYTFLNFRWKCSNNSS
jgi:hypothetical protein